jgi:hypothetical protein
MLVGSRPKRDSLEEERRGERVSASIARWRLDTGVFPAAPLARVEEHLEYPIGRYFDRGHLHWRHHRHRTGFRAALPARDILKLYIEEGPAIFDQHHAL